MPLAEDDGRPGDALGEGDRAHEVLFAEGQLLSGREVDRGGVAGTVERDGAGDPLLVPGPVPARLASPGAEHDDGVRARRRVFPAKRLREDPRQRGPEDGEGGGERDGPEGGRP
ncbi:MAG: hypothetical protein FD126_948, partial [Elusimicrobia bacterium]